MQRRDRLIAEMLASMSIDEIVTLVTEMELNMASPETRIRHVLRPLSDID